MEAQEGASRWFSPQQLDNLTSLVLEECTHLSQLPEALGELKSLKMLSLVGCVRLKALPREGWIGLSNLKTIDLRRQLQLIGGALQLMVCAQVFRASGAA